MMRPKSRYFLLPFLFAACASSASAAEAPSGATITAILENDSWVDNRTDRHYTSGAYFSWTSAPSVGDSYAAFTDALLLSPEGGAAYRHSFLFGQSICTPANLVRAARDPNDRPYGGWLYAGVKLFRETGGHLDRVEAKLGMVGPSSLAGDTQIFIHELGIFGGARPRGWRNQLHDEPGIVLSRQRIWRSAALRIGGLEVEALPEANVSLGNIFTYAGAGMSLRLGQHIDADWGPAAIAPSLEGADFVHYERQPFAWYLYAGFEGRAVARNIFLDGNSFQSSASIAKEPLVGDFRTGLVVHGPGVSLNVTYTLRSNEFKKQRGADEFLGATVSFQP